MTNLTTNMALKKATATDNAETYLETDLGGSLDTVDAHRHRGGSSGLLVDTLSASQAAGDLFYATGANAIARLAAGTGSQVLIGGASAPSWGSMPAAAIAGGTLTAAMFSAEVWTDYTPTLTQSSGVAITVNWARYRVEGKTARVLVNVTATGAGTGGNDISLSLPVAAPSKWAGSYAVIGTGIVADVSSQLLACAVVASSAGAVKFTGYKETGNIGTTPNFALAAGDVVAVKLEFEVA